MKSAFEFSESLNEIRSNIRKRQIKERKERMRNLLTPEEKRLLKQVVVGSVAASFALVISVHLAKKSLARSAMDVYSFGADSILKIRATADEATAYNRVVQAFFDAQREVFKKTGERWDPRSSLWMEVQKGDLKIYNRLADRVGKAIKLIDQSKSPIDLGGDFLVRN